MVRGMRWPLLTLCTAAALCLPAQAQVVRCTDARTGAVVYTDGGCASGTAAREVEPRKTEEEIRQERIQAAEALERKQQRLDAEATAARQQAERDALRPRAAPPPPQYAHTQECVRSRRLVQEAADAQAREPLVHNPRLEAAQRQMDLDCLGPEGYAELEKARAQRPQVVVVPLGRPVHTAPPQRPKLTHCTDFTCFDTRFGEVPSQRLVDPGRLARTERDLDRAVAVCLCGLDLRHTVVGHVEHRHGNGIAVIRENAHHAHLAAQQSEAVA